MPFTRPSVPRFVWVIAALILIVAFVFAVDLTEWVRGGYGWRWRYIAVPFERLIPLLVLLIIYITGAWHILKTDKSRALTLAWALMGSVALAIAVAYVREGDALYTLFTRTVSEQAAGEHYYAMRVNWSAGALANWTQVMDQYGGQVGTSPPGLFLLYALVESLMNAFPSLAEDLYRVLLPYQCHNFDLLTMSPAEWSAAWLGIFTPLWAGLSVFPLYGITRRLSGDESAKQAALWWALIPGVLMFATSSSTFFPFLALVTFWLLLRGLSARGGARVGWLVGAGIVYGLGLFLNFVFLPLAALYGFYTLLFCVVEERQPVSLLQRLLRTVIVGIWFALGALIVWAVYWLISGLTPLDLLAQALTEHLELDRPYAFWVWFHMWDWAVFTGLAFAAVWLWGMVADLRDSANRQMLPYALGLAVLALTLSGTTRGESGRIWLFLSPFVLISAAFYLMRYQRRTWLVLTVAQAVLTLALAANLEVYGTPELSKPPEPPTVQTNTPVDAQFIDFNGDGFRLVGWSAAAENRDAITLRLNWLGESRPLEAYYFGVTLVAPDGETYPTEAWQPARQTADVTFPTTCWSAGVMIGDEVRLDLPSEAVSGDWWLSLGVYGDENLPFERLRVLTSTGEDSQIGLGPVNVE